MPLRFYGSETHTRHLSLGHKHKRATIEKSSFPKQNLNFSPCVSPPLPPCPWQSHLDPFREACSAVTALSAHTGPAAAPQTLLSLEKYLAVVHSSTRTEEATQKGHSRNGGHLMSRASNFK